MNHSYTSEIPSRWEFIENSMNSAKASLGQLAGSYFFGGQQALAKDLLQRMDDWYIPNVSDKGVISVRPSRLHTNDLPVIALRPGEVLQRDETFTIFEPQQFIRARQIYAEQGLEQMAADPIMHRVSDFEKNYLGMHGKVEAAEWDAVTTRLEIGNSGFTEGATSVFGMRPLLVLRYGSDVAGVDKPFVGPGLISSALAQCLKFTENTVYLAPSENFGLHCSELHNQWMLDSSRKGIEIIRSLGMLGVQPTDHDMRWMSLYSARFEQF